MKTDKAIEFIEEEIIYWGPTVCTTMKKKPYVVEAGNPVAVKVYKEIIKLLKQGKKHEVMWKSIVNASKCLNDPKGRKILKMVIKDIKQGMKESEKYFKEAKNYEN